MEATAKEGCKLGEAHTMNGGDGNYSYLKNSSFQGRIGESVKPLIEEAITEKLDTAGTTINSSPTIFRIADLGCSVGPNTLFAMQTVVESIEKKLLGSQTNSIEFQVFFSDHTSNDFNTLFKSLPTRKTYYAAGVPGSFYGRLFPNSSLHFVYTSCAIHWLSRVPKEVLDKNNVAWNKGKIYYLNDINREVALAYSRQHARDMDIFLQARAREIVVGGLMTLVILTRSNGDKHHACLLNKTIDALGSCLVDMVKKGAIEEEELDLFNIPIYVTSPQELEESIRRNGCFDIEKNVSLPHLPRLQDTSVVIKVFVKNTRAIMEGLLKEQFGHDILDELFDAYENKLEEGRYFDVNPEDSAYHFFVLKRNAIP